MTEQPSISRAANPASRVMKFRAWSFTDQSWINPATIEVWDETGILAAFYGGDYVIEQWTGLKDSSGREIYEGDIIRAAVITDDAYVTRCPELSAFHWYSELEEALEEGKSCEVIGNVHEHPDLLNLEYRVTQSPVAPSNPEPFVMQFAKQLSVQSYDDPQAWRSRTDEERAHYVALAQHLISLVNKHRSDTHA